MATITTTALTVVGERERKRISEIYVDAKDPRKKNRLNSWEMNFIETLYSGSSMPNVTWTAKQLATLERIEEKYYAT